jgi:hypothetical protein
VFARRRCQGERKGGGGGRERERKRARKRERKKESIRHSTTVAFSRKRPVLVALKLHIYVCVTQKRLSDVRPYVVWHRKPQSGGQEQGRYAACWLGCGRANITEAGTRGRRRNFRSRGALTEP